VTIKSESMISTMETPSIGIVIPCFNESKNLPGLIHECREVSKLGKVTFLVVDNGSTDDTKQILEKLLPQSGVSSLRVEKNVGYGNGIKVGLRSLNTEYLGWIHADLQTSPNEILKMSEKILMPEVPELIKGFRKNRPLADRFYTAGMSLYSSIKLRCLIRDANGQPTIMSRSLYDTWENIPDDFSIDISCLHTAISKKAKIYRVHTNFGPRKYGYSSWNTGILSRLKLTKRTIKFINELAREITK
jgi:glycosyltransferase involved in cell wall biosynthesis